MWSRGRNIDENEVFAKARDAYPIGEEESVALREAEEAWIRHILVEEEGGQVRNYALKLLV